MTVQQFQIDTDQRARDFFAEPISVKNLAVVLQNMDRLRENHNKIQFADSVNEETEDRVDFTITLTFSEDDITIHPGYEELIADKIHRINATQWQFETFEGQVDRLYELRTISEGLVVVFWLEHPPSFAKIFKMFSDEEWLGLLSAIHNDRRELQNLHMIPANLKSLYMQTADIIASGMKESLRKGDQRDYCQ